MIFEAKNSQDALELAKKHALKECDSLESKHNQKVMFYVFYMGEDEGKHDVAIAYMKEPNRAGKMGAMDLIYGMRTMDAAENIWIANQLKDITDERIINSDDLYIGLMNEIVTEIKYMAVALKKN
jgi:uncharacterized protein YneR